MEKLNYITPEIEVINVVVEQGFAASEPMEGVDRNPSIPW